MDAELLEELRAFCCEDAPETPSLVRVLREETVIAALFEPRGAAETERVRARFLTLCPGGAVFSCGRGRLALLFLERGLAGIRSVERAAVRFQGETGEGAVFCGCAHTGAHGARLSYLEAAQTLLCNRYYLPCGSFREISGVLRQEPKPIRLIQLERAMVGDIENQQGRNLTRYLREWFGLCRSCGMEDLRMAALSLYAVFKWKVFDKLILNEVQVKLGIEFYELLNIQTPEELEEWFIQWARYTMTITGTGREDGKRRIAAALTYMEEHLDTATAAGTAAYLYLNPSYFSTLFKRETGAAFRDRLIELRMRRAAEMLSSGRSVQEIARAVGYEDTKHFRELFRACYHTTPSDYRRQSRR